MRKVTVTEKYRAVNEGQLSKGNFLRDMRMAYPSVITQLNGYDTSVRILKNKGYIIEKSAIESYDSRMDLNISPDSIDRGVRYEMQAREKDPANTDDVKHCKGIVMKNLKKDPLHYIMLISNDSSKVDKHDKEVEVKRGAKDVDTFNGLKKADLKENKKELAKLLKEGSLQDLADRLGVPIEKLMGAADKIKDMERYSAERDALKLSKMKEVIDEEENEDTDEVMNIDRFGNDKQDHDSNYTKIREDDDEELSPEELANKHAGTPFFREAAEGHMVDEHEHMFFSLIFNKKYDNILEDYMSSDTFKQDEKELQDSTGQTNVFDASYADQWENYIKEFEASNYDSLDEATKIEKEERLREAVKNIIVRTLNEDTVNEAATNQLAKYAEEYSSFQGMKETIIALENIVTEIESFYDKTKGKIQKIYDSIGEVRNEEGLKVGAFIAPSIENAFNRDLRPIVKAGFTKGLDVPKLKKAKFDGIKNETPVYEQEPKKSVFSPVYENKKKSKKSKK